MARHTAIQPSSVLHVASASARCSIGLMPRAVVCQEAVLHPLMSYDIQTPTFPASPQRPIPVLLLPAADCVSEFARSLAILTCLVCQVLFHLAPRSFWLFLGHRSVLRVIGWYAFMQGRLCGARLRSRIELFGRSLRRRWIKQ